MVRRGPLLNALTVRAVTAVVLAVWLQVIGSGAWASHEAESRPTRPPLIDAAIRGDTAAVVDLIGMGADINGRDESGVTAIYLSVYLCADEKCLEVLCALLDHGADANIGRRDGFSPLHLACELSEVSAAKLLIAHGARVSAVEQSMGDTPLHVAVKVPDRGGRKREVIRLLLAHGADITQRNTDGKSPIDIVTTSGDPGLVDFIQQEAAKASGAARGRRGGPTTAPAAR